MMLSHFGNGRQAKVTPSTPRLDRRTERRAVESDVRRTANVPDVRTEISAAPRHAEHFAELHAAPLLAISLTIFFALGFALGFAFFAGLLWPFS